MTIPEFCNEALTDFADPARAEAMRAALARVRERLGERIDLRLGGGTVRTEASFLSLDPTDPSVTVAQVSRAGREHAEQALQAALGAFETWKRVPAGERARYCLEAASRMRDRRLDFAAWMVVEVGKSWVEADADVAEAIDFLEFYGREAIRLDAGQELVPLAGERNELRYIPLGVGLVIPPWNFPLAILVGMTSAAFAAGNTVVLKPASASPAIAARFVELLEEIGLPAGVVNFVPGSGAEIGDFLVEHPKVRFIAFTGSKEVGLGIHEKASRLAPGQVWLKRAILEMGGKDAIVVDETADLGAAADGIAAAAFGFQGQKCSACSRAIVVDAVYDQVLAGVLECARRLKVGSTTDPANTVGPVVDEGAFRKIMEHIEVGKAEAELVLGGGRAREPGWFIEPTVFAGVDPRARIAQEEIFGPVLAFIRARDFEDALRIANDTEYGLTGALYSRDEARLARAADDFHVGNLYLNRKCTGALVGVHPFGGFKLSGTDSKAGGKDYLLLFMQAKSVSRKV